MSHATHRQSKDEEIYRKVAESPLYRAYRNAFFDATGLTLDLLPAEPEIAPLHPREFKTEFCRQLNNRNTSFPCRACTLSHQCLGDSSTEKPKTVTCFAGMRETVVPVRSDGKTIALLTTGQIFTEEKGNADFAAVKESLAKAGLESHEIESLRRTWLDVPVVSKSAYEGAITLLSAFGLQLSEMLNQLSIESDPYEPALVTKAKRYISAHIEDHISLEDVSRHVGVSTFYFCKIFKQSTGTTMTRFINRRRVEMAKKRLLEPNSRVTEVAFDIGYQSLSQFNRSFLKYAGESPTQFRKRHFKREHPGGPAAA